MIQIVSSLLLTLMYFMAGLSKILNFNTVAVEFQNKMQVLAIIAQIIIALVVVIEIVAPLIIVENSFNRNNNTYAKYATYSLIGFTILATLLYHMPPTGSNYYSVMSNITAVGGLLLLSTQL